MILSKFYSLGEAHYTCDCDESAEFSFREAYGEDIDMLVCPYCGECYDYDAQDAIYEDEEPMTHQQYMNMKL